ncbi:DUF2061 domain-containing protein [Magnetococcus sp. PR-3]|uniref:DUF2061 domain-containing protein n=1 Tax=Magnetococcus sp. PR-3 TaxID=3120355 RepID=UPI002FCE4DB5
MAEKMGRSAAKTLSWRCLATLTTMLVVWGVTGELATAVGIGAIEATIKMFIYYAHERAWARVSWGQG